MAEPAGLTGARVPWVVSHPVLELVRDGFVLEQDIDLVVQNAVDRYDVAVARIPETRPV